MQKAKAIRFTALLVEPDDELRKLLLKIKEDGAIAYNGDIPHKICHFTISPPKNITLFRASAEIIRIIKEDTMPRRFRITGVKKIQYSPKIAFTGRFDREFEHISWPHMTIAEFASNEDAAAYFDRNKLVFDMFMNKELRICHSMYVIKKNYGAETSHTPLETIGG